MESDVIKIEVEKEIVSPLVTAMKNFAIKTADDLANAGRTLIRIKEAIKSVREKFKDPKEKAYQAHKAISEMEKKLLAPLEECESKIKSEMARFEEMKRKEQAEAQAKLEAKAVKAEEKGKFDKAEEIRSQVVVKDVPKVDGISYTTVWKFEVVDANAVPREYLMVDEKKIGAVVKATKGTLAIPGVRIFSTKTVSART